MLQDNNRQGPNWDKPVNSYASRGEYSKLLAFYESICDNTNDALVMFDLQGEVLYANRAFLKLLGYEQNEAMGSKLWALLRLDPYRHKGLTANPLQGETVQLTLEAATKTGGTIPVSVKCGPVILKNAIVGGYAIITDISHRREAGSEGEKRLRALINKSRIGIVIIGQDHRVIEANNHFAQMLGYSQEELQKLHTWDWEANMTEEEVRREFRDLANTNHYFETRHRRKDGIVIDVEVSATGTHIDGYNAVMCICRDISDRKQAEKALRQSEAKFRNYVENASDIILILNSAGITTYVSPNIKKLRGWERREVEGKSFSVLVHPEDLDHIARFIEKLFSGNQVEEGVEYRVRHKDGSWHWYTLNGSRTEDENHDPILICIARNICERKKYEEQLKFLSLHDQLTGLYNRTFFENELQRLEKSRQYPISLLSCDLDGLKRVNDTLGHQAGDNLLKISAQLLKSSLRSSDIVARVGGDEFVAILPETDAETAAGIVRRIYYNVQSYNQDENKGSFSLSISIGSATTMDASRPLTQVLKDADQRMYCEKKASKLGKCNQCLYLDNPQQL